MDRLLAPILQSTEDHAAELARCAADLPHWLATYGTTYDPRRLPQDPTVRFTPFPRQVELLAWIAEREAKREGGLVEKSRDTGVTYCCCAYALHGWLFRPGFACGFGSRKLELVDKLGDPSSIFEKLRILLRGLPAWMMPAGFRWSDHDNFARLLNPANGATIVGEGGDQIGRGGRVGVYFVDEAAFIERPALLDGSLAATTDVRIDVSTPNGPGNKFAEKRHSGKVPVFTFRWQDDPRKGVEWYARQVAEKDPVTIAQEFDIDYTASVEGITIPALWVRAAVDLPLEASGPVTAGLDIAAGGSNRSVFIPRQGPVARRPVDWGQLNTTQTARRALEEARRANVSVLNYDCVGVGEGVRGTFEEAAKDEEAPLPCRVVAVNSGATPSDRRWPDGKTARAKFLNLRAEMWRSLRLRFEKAYEYRLFLAGQEGGKEHPHEEMISIPNDERLISDLSLPLSFETEGGKIKLESKDSMARRGVKSPDFGDALALTEAPAPCDVRITI